MPQIAFLGAGNMAAAIIDGLLSKQIVSSENLSCIGGSGKTAPALAARTGIRLASSIEQLCENADVLIIAFKPQHLAAASATLAALTKGKLVLSLLAGKRLATLAKYFPDARSIVRTMPNTPGRIGAGITGWCSNNTLSQPDRSLVTSMLEALGVAQQIKESLMDTVTAVSGSGTGFVFEFAAALTEAAVAEGMSPEMARVFVAEVFAGSGKLLKVSAENPETLRKQVTSPNGTTAAGLAALENGNLRSVIHAAVKAAKSRSTELSKD